MNTFNSVLFYFIRNSSWVYVELSIECIQYTVNGAVITESTIKKKRENKFNK